MTDDKTDNTPSADLFSGAPRIREDRIEYMRVVVAYSPFPQRRAAAMLELVRLGAMTSARRH